MICSDPLTRCACRAQDLFKPAKQKQHSGVGKGAGPTAPWDGPSFWASGTSASRGVALLFKASPLLSGIYPAAADPNGRFIAAQGNRSRQPRMLSELECFCMSMEISPYTTSIICTGNTSKLQSSATCKSAKTPLEQTSALQLAGSKLAQSLAASSQLTAPAACSGSFLLTC